MSITFRLSPCWPRVFVAPFLITILGGGIQSMQAQCADGKATSRTLYVRYYIQSSAFDFLLNGDCITTVHKRTTHWACVTATTKFGQTHRGWVSIKFIAGLGPATGGNCRFNQ